MDSARMGSLNAMEPANPKVLTPRAKLKMSKPPRSFFHVPPGLDRLGHPDIPLSQVA